MKKILTTTAVAMISFGALAQGVVNFSTAAAGPNGTANAPGTNRVTGARAAGTDYMAQLFYNDPRTTTDDAVDPRIPGGTTPLLTPLAGIATFATGSLAGYINANTGGGNRTLDGVAAGSDAQLQIRAWSSSLGNNWDTALNNWRASAGAANQVLGGSGVFTIPTGNPPLVPATALTGANPGFFLNPVPEPSTIALGILGGLGTLLLFRRRK